MNEEKKRPLIQVENLEKIYPKGTKAVNGVSFTISEGETLGLVGESGCGKTTIGKLLVGLEKPTAGTILFDGHDITNMKERELKRLRTQFQMVFQDTYSSLNPRKHIYEILSQPMLYHKISSKDTVEKDMVKLLDMVGLPKSTLGRYPHEFSGGQRQRIGIAKALSLNPRFLICDEPVSALDVSIQVQILNLLKDLKKDLNLTMLFIGHGLGTVHYISDRVAVMYQGQFVETGDAEEVFHNPQHPYTKILLGSAPVPRVRQSNFFEEEKEMNADVSKTGKDEKKQEHPSLEQSFHGCSSSEGTMQKQCSKSDLKEKSDLKRERNLKKKYDSGKTKGGDAE